MIELHPGTRAAEARVGALGAPPEDRVEAELRHPRPAGVEESGAGDQVDFVGVGPEPPRSLVGLERRIEGVLLRLDAPLPELHPGSLGARRGPLDRALLLVSRDAPRCAKGQKWCPRRIKASADRWRQNISRDLFGFVTERA
jgi:hypothetical protein